MGGLILVDEDNYNVQLRIHVRCLIQTLSATPSGGKIKKTSEISLPVKGRILKTFNRSQILINQNNIPSCKQSIITTKRKYFERKWTDIRRSLGELQHLFTGKLLKGVLCP